jgi:hypothetical protein
MTRPVTGPETWPASYPEARSAQVTSGNMTGARLVVDASNIVLRSNGPATGDIALAIAGTVFPVEGWNDFSVVILEAWLRALVLLMSTRRRARVRVHFMEGPFAVDLVRRDSGAIEVRAVERRATGELERAVAEAAPLNLMEDAVSAAGEVVAHCRRQGPSSRDLEQLEAALEAATQALMRLRVAPESA